MAGLLEGCHDTHKMPSSPRARVGSLRGQAHLCKAFTGFPEGNTASGNLGRDMQHKAMCLASLRKALVRMRCGRCLQQVARQDLLTWLRKVQTCAGAARRIKQVRVGRGDLDASHKLLLLVHNTARQIHRSSSRGTWNSFLQKESEEFVARVSGITCMSIRQVQNIECWRSLAKASLVIF